jgi:hypothetical protein
MSVFALTAELLIAAANSMKCMVTYRPTAAEPSLMPVVGDQGMEFVDPDLRAAVRSMLDAAMKLDNYALNQDEGEDVSLAVSSSEWLRKRADRLLPSQPAWPTGEGMADVIDMATWRRKEA